MKLSAVLLRERLEEIVVSCHYGQNSEQLNLDRPEFIVEKSALFGGRLYIAQPERLPAACLIPDGCCLICVGEPELSYIGKGYSVICVREDLDIFGVFNRLSKVYAQYDNWELQMLQCISEKTPIQRFVDVSMCIFENQMYIVDSTLRQLAKSKHDVFPSTLSDSIMEDMENMVKHYASVQSVSDKDDAAMLMNDQLKLRIITKSLRSHDHFAMAVTLVETNRPFRESDVILLDYMSYYVLTSFEFGHTLTDVEENPITLTTVLAQLFRDEEVPVEKIKKAQSVFGWEPEHSLCLFYVKTPKPEHNFATRIYQCRQMERQFTSAIATASVGENYAVIANVSLCEKYNDSILRFTTVLRNFNFACGMSCMFNDLTLVRVTDFYSQAKFAYYNGSSSNPGETIYKFSDYRLQFLLSHCCGEQDSRYLFPDGFKEMAYHDKLFGTSHLKTLTVYCDCKFNATHAAERLNIHRTTFLDRFSRIQDYLRIDFGDPADRLHLLIALELLKTQK